MIGELYKIVMDKEPVSGPILKRTFMSGIGAVVGLLSSTAVKIVLQLAMIILFILWLVF